MKRAMGMALCLALLLTASLALAGGEAPAYFKKRPEDGEMQDDAVYFEKRTEGGVTTAIFGGSGRDWLYYMDISDDGLIALTGWTESSDGTLSSRTKTGRSGWLQVIDREGNEVFSFCTRLGVHDVLKHPVFHDDGTLTAMLNAESREWVKLELICLDMEGNVISRKVLREMPAEDERHIDVIGCDARGYILYETLISGEDSYTHYFLYDWDGQLVARQETWENGLNAIAQQHVIRRRAEDEEEYWLYRREADGSEREMAKVFAVREDRLRPRMYSGFVSLPDGGAAGAGWVLEKEEASEARPGLFTRWDAQGNVVSEMITPGVQYTALTPLPDGFAAMGHPDETTEGPQDEDFEEHTLYLMDGSGVITRTISLGTGVGIGPECPIGTLLGGTVVAVQVVKGQDDDARVTIIKP